MSHLEPYWHPFHTQSIEHGEDLEDGREQPRTIIEMKMIALSNSIREKPEWWVKMKTPEITTKWRADVHEQQKDVPERWRLDDEMINYVFDELEGYATLRDPSTGIQPGPFDRVWKSDELVSAELRNQLLEAIVPLEEMTPDWHPGSNDQVLDLVHPSLYPIVYGRTLMKKTTRSPRDFSGWHLIKYNGDLDAVKKTVSLNATMLQCIIKLANIVLTPDNPEYPSGSWHVEGMMNEHIVASYIYYYDNENITASSLAFRRATSQPEYHEQGDSWCMKFLYNIKRDDPLVQELGKVETRHGRSVAFPNIYQHQVAPFQLEDPTKPGHRKILVFFLVDPTMTVISASDVAPQQRERIQEIIRSAAPNSEFGNLPVELLDMIEKLVDGTMTRKKPRIIAWT